MKILKITTYWTPEEADCIFNLLGELQAMIWESYGDDITHMYRQVGEEQQNIKRKGEETFNAEIPF